GDKKTLAVKNSSNPVQRPSMAPCITGKRAASLSCDGTETPSGLSRHDFRRTRASTTFARLSSHRRRDQAKLDREVRGVFENVDVFQYMGEALLEILAVFPIEGNAAPR